MATELPTGEPPAFAERMNPTLCDPRPIDPNSIDPGLFALGPPNCRQRTKTFALEIDLAIAEAISSPFPLLWLEVGNAPFV